jgi:hypothetical protein
MALFPKRDRNSSGKRSAASALELVYESDASNRALAIGVRWKRIASAGGRQDAWRIAREASASHAVFQGQQLGMGVMPQGVDRSTRVYPAALIAARHLGGNNLVALRIDAGFYWICETHSGQPTDVDEVLHGVDDAAVLARIRQLIERNAALGGPIPLHTNIEDTGLPTRSLELSDLFGSVLTDADQIAPLPKATPSIPKPVLVAGGVVVLVLAGQHGLKKYEMWQRAKELAARQAEMVDPTQAWNEAIATWERGVAAPDSRGLMAVRAELDKLPVEWLGWRLERADCSAAQFNGSMRTWTCQASYKRGPLGVTNQQLVSKIPAGWSAVWLPLGALRVSWTVQQPARQIAVAQLRKPEFFNIEVASRIQEIASAVGPDLSFVFAPVVIPAPKQQDGSAIPADPRAAGLQSAALVIKAPLRSLDALMASEVEASFKSLSLIYAAEAESDMKSSPSSDAADLSKKIKTSALQVEVKGDLYAKK